jgi:hypothetical protein
MARDPLLDVLGASVLMYTTMLVVGVVVAHRIVTEVSLTWSTRTFCVPTVNDDWDVSVISKSAAEPHA